MDINDINAISQKTIKPKKLLQIIQGTTISSSLKNRRSKGSSGISEQTRMISQRTKRISLYRNSIKKQNSVVKRSFDSLSKRVKTHTKKPRLIYFIFTFDNKIIIHKKSTQWGACVTVLELVWSYSITAAVMVMSVLSGDAKKTQLTRIVQKYSILKTLEM